MLNRTESLEFFEKVENKKIRWSTKDWEGYHFIPKHLVSRYDCPMLNGYLVSTDGVASIGDFPVSCGFISNVAGNHWIFVENDEGEVSDVEKPEICQRSCVCSMTVLMLSGCQCGGV